MEFMEAETLPNPEVRMGLCPNCNKAGMIRPIGGCESGGEAWPPATLPQSGGFFVVETPVQRQDAVNHPPHYNFGKIEVISVIEDWKLPYHLGNVVKYVARAPHKGTELQDLKKAQFYLNRHISRLESK